jgi:hypothetical protein
VTDYPTAEWVVQQLREAFPEAGPYRYAIFDRGSTFNEEMVRERSERLAGLLKYLPPASRMSFLTLREAMLKVQMAGALNSPSWNICWVHRAWEGCR